MRKGNWIKDATFHADIHYIESLWQRTIILQYSQRLQHPQTDRRERKKPMLRPIPPDAGNSNETMRNVSSGLAMGTTEMPLIDIGQGAPLVFVPTLEHFEFVYARQIYTLSENRRVILYRRPEMRTREIGLEERVEELRLVLDGLKLEQPDLIGHGYATIVLFAFALRYPHRCRSLTIIAQGPDYHISPYPLTRLLNELYIRLPIEYVLPVASLRQAIIQRIIACARDNYTSPALPRHLIEEQLRKIYQLPSVYKCSILPVIRNFDIRKQVNALTMPILLINRADDVLSPEAGTRWLAEHLPHCAGYHIISGREHFFMYSQADTVTPLIEAFLASPHTVSGPLKQTQS
jgi:pimeloyl-ACP methyl ester carboxylesterase